MYSNMIIFEKSNSDLAFAKIQWYYGCRSQNAFSLQYPFVANLTGGEEYMYDELRFILEARETKKT